MTAESQAARILKSYHVLAVPDIDRTARWWIEVMGFRTVMRPEGWHFVGRDGCMIMLGECPDAIDPRHLGDHQYFAYFVVDNLDAYHNEIVARRPMILSPPQDKPWGMREMAVRTPDGHRVMFGEDLEAAPG